MSQWIWGNYHLASTSTSLFFFFSDRLTGDVVLCHDIFSDGWAFMLCLFEYTSQRQEVIPSAHRESQTWTHCVGNDVWMREWEKKSTAVCSILYYYTFERLLLKLLPHWQKVNLMNRKFHQDWCAEHHLSSRWLFRFVGIWKNVLPHFEHPYSSPSWADFHRLAICHHISKHLLLGPWAKPSEIHLHTLQDGSFLIQHTDLLSLLSFKVGKPCRRPKSHPHPVSAWNTHTHTHTHTHSHTHTLCQCTPLPHL